jgi:hypothetical protein
MVAHQSRAAVVTLEAVLVRHSFRRWQRRAIPMF